MTANLNFILKSFLNMKNDKNLSVVNRILGKKGRTRVIANLHISSFFLNTLQIINDFASNFSTLRKINFYKFSEKILLLKQLYETQIPNLPKGN